jgi:hypothetical protein
MSVFTGENNVNNSYVLIQFSFVFKLYPAIKLICNRVIHESEIVCRFLNKKTQFKT